MLAYTYIEKGKFVMAEKPKPMIQEPTDAIVRVTMSSICTLLCTMLKNPKRIIVCEQSAERRAFVKSHYAEVLLTTPEECSDFVIKNSIIHLLQSGICFVKYT